MSSYSFRADGLPITQGSKTIMRGRLREDRAAVLGPWRALVNRAATLAHEGAPFAGPVAVDLVFDLPRPVSHPKRTRTWPTARNDIDKLSRACLDAMTGVSYGDDGQVVRLLAVKDFGPTPGVTVTVRQIRGES